MLVFGSGGRLHLESLPVWSKVKPWSSCVNQAFASMEARRIGALVLLDDGTLVANAPAAAEHALRRRPPSIGLAGFCDRRVHNSLGASYMPGCTGEPRLSLVLWALDRGQNPRSRAFSRARHERFRDSDMFRRVFELLLRAVLRPDWSAVKGSRSMRA